MDNRSVRTVIGLSNSLTPTRVVDFFSPTSRHPKAPNSSRYLFRRCALVASQWKYLKYILRRESFVSEAGSNEHNTNWRSQ